MKDHDLRIWRMIKVRVQDMAAIEMVVLDHNPTSPKRGWMVIYTNNCVRDSSGNPFCGVAQKDCSV